MNNESKQPTNEKQHSKLYFVCPKCGKALYPKDNLRDIIQKQAPQYCTKCGEKIASALREALADS